MSVLDESSKRAIRILLKRLERFHDDRGNDRRQPVERAAHRGDLPDQARTCESEFFGGNDKDGLDVRHLAVGDGELALDGQVGDVPDAAQDRNPGGPV